MTNNKMIEQRNENDSISRVGKRLVTFKCTQLKKDLRDMVPFQMQVIKSALQITQKIKTTTMM